MTAVRPPCAVILAGILLWLPGGAGARVVSGAGPEQPVETILAGGALAICSNLAPRACQVALEGARQPPRHRLDEAGITRAGDPRLWSAPGAPEAAAVAGWLEGLAARDAGDVLDVEALDALLARGEAASPWSRMTDAERAAVRSALEAPQLDARGERIRERVDLGQSREQGGVAVLEAFVTAARARAGGARPQILVVTASAFDPMEPVDFYEAVFTALGAESRWWPVDAAMARARFPERDCGALESHRLAALGIAGRAQVYPDLATRAAAFCAEDDGGLPDVHGVFFAGGDQWRLRRAFVDADDRPNPWLAALRAAHAAGRVVVGGTSAGAAVQSGAAMLSNGSVAAALEGRIAMAPPPEPGCGRAARCPPGFTEDALTLWPAGGLGLAHEAIVDTHFSERARELRLLVAMAATGAAWGYGVDETSALRVREWPDRREIDALGAHGGWVFRRLADDAVEAWYLAPGARLVIRGDAVAWAGLDAAARPPRPAAVAPSDALAPGALRAAAARLAWRCGRPIGLAAGERRATLACLAGATEAGLGTNGRASVGPLRLALGPRATGSDGR